MTWVVANPPPTNVHHVHTSFPTPLTTTFVSCWYTFKMLCTALCHCIVVVVVLCVRNIIPHATFTLLPLVVVVRMWCSIHSSSTLSTTKCMSIPYIRVCPSHALYDLATILPWPDTTTTTYRPPPCVVPFRTSRYSTPFLSHQSVCVVTSCHVMCILRLCSVVLRDVWFVSFLF